MAQKHERAAWRVEVGLAAASAASCVAADFVHWVGESYMSCVMI